MLNFPDRILFCFGVVFNQCCLFEISFIKKNYLDIFEIYFCAVYEKSTSKMFSNIRAILHSCLSLHNSYNSGFICLNIM